MTKRLAAMVLGICFLAMLTSSAGAVDLPSRTVFSRSYEQVQNTIREENPVYWRLNIQPRQIRGFDGKALEAMSAIVSALDAHGSLQAYKEGGGMIDAEISSGDRMITGISQYASADHVALYVDGQWLAIEKTMEDDAVAGLGLDAFVSALLFDMDYKALYAGDTPFLSNAYRQGEELWLLASPYAQDTQGMRVPSGSTSHALVYEIDTQGLRSILSQWADDLTDTGLGLGVGGTDLSLVVGDEGYTQLIDKIRVMAESVELSKPIELKMTFGEADVLRTVRGTGSLLEDGSRKSVSYSYTYEESDTRIARKYKIDLQPRSGDTLVLSCTWRTTSNNRAKAVQELTLTASGNYNGEPYKIKIDNNMENKYALNDLGALEEKISGTLTMSLQYAGRKVADITIKRSGTAAVTDGQGASALIEDSYDVTIKDEDGVLFEGIVSLTLQTDAETYEAMDVLAEARRYEDMDEGEMEGIKTLMQEEQMQMRQRLIQALPDEAIRALMQAY